MLLLCYWPLIKFKPTLRIRALPIVDFGLLRNRVFLRTLTGSATNYHVPGFGTMVRSFPHVNLTGMILPDNAYCRDSFGDGWTDKLAMG